MTNLTDIELSNRSLLELLEGYDTSASEAVKIAFSIPYIYTRLINMSYYYRNLESK